MNWTTNGRCPKDFGESRALGLLTQQKSEEVVKLGLGNRLGKIVGHQRGFRFPDFANFVAGDSLLLAGGIDVDPLLPLLSTEKARHQIPIVKGHDAVAKNPVHVTVRIKHIFAQALKAPMSYAIELRAH